MSSAIEQFLKPGADRVKLSMALKPESGNYEKVFADAAMAKMAELKYENLWDSVKNRPLGPKDGQTKILLYSATTDELKKGKGNSRKFPGGYKRMAQHLKDGLTIYRFKFVRPGKTLGMAYDGLYNIDGRWVLMPKPWRIAR